MHITPNLASHIPYSNTFCLCIYDQKFQFLYVYKSDAGRTNTSGGPDVAHVFETPCFRPYGGSLTPRSRALKNIPVFCLEISFPEKYYLAFSYLVFSEYFTFPVKCVSIYSLRKSFILMGKKESYRFAEKKHDLHVYKLRTKLPSRKTIKK